MTGKSKPPEKQEGTPETEHIQREASKAIHTLEYRTDTSRKPNQSCVSSTDTSHTPMKSPGHFANLTSQIKTAIIKSLKFITLLIQSLISHQKYTENLFYSVLRRIFREDTWLDSTMESSLPCQIEISTWIQTLTCIFNTLAHSTYFLFWLLLTTHYIFIHFQSLLEEQWLTLAVASLMDIFNACSCSWSLRKGNKNVTVLHEK